MVDRRLVDEPLRIRVVVDRRELDRREAGKEEVPGLENLLVLHRDRLGLDRRGLLRAEQPSRDPSACPGAASPATKKDERKIFLSFKTKRRTTFAVGEVADSCPLPKRTRVWYAGSLAKRGEPNPELRRRKKRATSGQTRKAHLERPIRSRGQNRPAKMAGCEAKKIFLGPVRGQKECLVLLLY